MTDQRSTSTFLVSVIIANYNLETFVGEAIDSALDQTYSHVEVVVVDDGSTDDSRGVIAGYGDRITPVLQENGGHASALNAGFVASQGEIVMLLDADDYLLSPRAVERVVAAWEPDVAQVHCRMKKVDALGNTIGFAPPLEVALGSGEVWRTLLEKGDYVGHVTGGLSFSRGVLDKILPIPEAEYSRAPESYLSTLAPFYGQVKSIEEPLAAYRIHDSNEYGFRGTPSSEYHLKTVGDRLKQHALIRHKAKELGYRVAPDLANRDYSTLYHRMILLRLDPQRYPISSDHRLNLLYWALHATWRNASFDRKRRLIHSVWFIWIALLPSSLARLAVDWLYVNESRPKALEWVRKKIRTL